MTESFSMPSLWLAHCPSLPTSPLWRDYNIDPISLAKSDADWLSFSPDQYECRKKP